MIDTIIFDFDGTLMNTNDLVLASWEYTFQTIRGVSAPRDQVIASFGEVLQETMARFFPEMDPEEATMIYRQWQEGNFGSKVSLFPGMKELVIELAAMGMKLGIATSRTRNATLEALEEQGIDQYFGAVITCDDTKEHKPSPVPVLMTLQGLDAKAENAVMIGDSRYDILCARNAGVRNAVVSWQMSLSEEELAGDFRPDFRMEEAMDLITIIREENA